MSKLILILLALFVLLQEAKAKNADEKKFFKTEFACYSQIAKNSSQTNEAIGPKYYYPLVTRQTDQWLGVEERYKGGQEARLYIFTEDGTYIKTLSQMKSFQEFRFIIKLDGKQKLVGLDRIESDSKYRSLMFVADEIEPAMKLSLETGEKVRKILIDSLADKIQSMKSTYDAISENRRRALSALMKKDPSSQGKTITLETYFESLPEKIQQQISKKQDPQEYIQQLNECKVALASDVKYQNLLNLVEAEISKFNDRFAPPANEVVLPNSTSKQ